MSAFLTWFMQNIVNVYSKNVPATVLFLLNKLEIDDDALSLFLKNQVEAASYIPLSVQLCLEKANQSIPNCAFPEQTQSKKRRLEEYSSTNVGGYDVYEQNSKRLMLCTENSRRNKLVGMEQHQVEKKRMVSFNQSETEH